MARIPGTTHPIRAILTLLKVTTTLPAAHRKTPPTDQVFSLRRAIRNLGNLRPMFKTRPFVKTVPPDSSRLRAHLCREPRLRCRKPSQIRLDRDNHIGCETQRCTVVITAIRVRIPTGLMATAHNQHRIAKRS